MEKIIDHIIKLLQQYADPERVALSKKSYPTKTQVLGVTVPNVKKVLKELKIQTKDYTSEQKIALCKKLVDTNIFECQQLAYEMIGRHKKLLKAMTPQDVDDLGKNLDNWISVDYYSIFILGYAWRVGLIDIAQIKSYLKSDIVWIRRSAVVATVALNQKARGATGDVDQTLEICQLVVDDHEDLMVKALSWALRELAKNNPQPVQEFLEKNSDRLHKKVIREVTKKITTGRKN
jgi:3-methyladenine DNA glycosylase AlkD